MWIYKFDLNDDILDKFKKYSKIAGFVFGVLGLIGILEPVFMTMATVTFVAWLMMFSGIASGYFTYKSNKHDYIGWLKSFALILVSAFMIFSPIGGAGTLGLLFSIYFFMDAFANFSLGMQMKGHKGWFYWILNSIISLVLAILFIINWPFSSLYLVGLLVGFSLFFDGLSLIMIGKSFDNTKR